MSSWDMYYPGNLDFITSVFMMNTLIVYAIIKLYLKAVKPNFIDKDPRQSHCFLL